MATAKTQVTQARERVHILEQTIRAHIWTHACVKYADGQVPPLAAGETIRLDGPIAEDSLACNMIVERLCGHVTTCKSEYEIRTFLAYVVVRRRLGIAFHPDTPFANYICLDTHDNIFIPMFTQEEADECDRLLNEAFNYIAVTPSVPNLYDLSVELIQELYLSAVGL